MCAQGLGPEELQLPHTEGPLYTGRCAQGSLWASSPCLSLSGLCFTEEESKLQRQTPQDTRKHWMGTGAEQVYGRWVDLDSPVFRVN